MTSSKDLLEVSGAVRGSRLVSVIVSRRYISRGKFQEERLLSSDLDLLGSHGILGKISVLEEGMWCRQGGPLVVDWWIYVGEVGMHGPYGREHLS